MYTHAAYLVVRPAAETLPSVYLSFQFTVVAGCHSVDVCTLICILFGPVRSLHLLLVYGLHCQQQQWQQPACVPSMPATTLTARKVTSPTQRPPPASQLTACRSALGAASRLYHRPWTHQLTRFQLAGVPCAVQAPPRPSKQEAPAGVLPHAPTGRQHAAGPKDAPLKSLFPPELPVPKQVPPLAAPPALQPYIFECTSVCEIEVCKVCWVPRLLDDIFMHAPSAWKLFHLKGPKLPFSPMCSVPQAPRRSRYQATSFVRSHHPQSHDQLFIVTPCLAQMPAC